ncbi:MAG: NAD(P)H-binding protein [Frankiaceae bacterium]|nr:NAD(P)H-binding protein [Frankiaceae bacterium]MBV9869927.1 NAD(P)H-binding protein [Frankiaceae bacterium]
MRRIGLLGATGYTGKLTATEFALRDLDVRLGARSAERLKDVDGTEGSERVVVDTSDPHALAGFMDGLDVVISTVGPFTALGRPVVDAAVTAGVHYIDSTGEPAFMTEVYDAYRSAATAVVPACGFDYLPGDCAAAVAADALGETPERIVVGYSIKGMRPSRGTARSSIEAVLAEPNPRLRRTEIEGHSAINLPWGENLTIPLWAPDTVVECAVTAPRVAAAVAPLAGSATGPLMRLTAPLVRRLVERLPEGPAEDVRANARTRVVATASAGGRSRTVGVDINDVYGFTALALVESALRVAGAGAMSPSQAIDAASILDAMRGPLLAWQRPAG